MERVKNVLQRLQELYHTKHPKSAIDIDLMLDYTRVLYADLLEWRQRFKDESPAIEAAVQQAEVPEPSSDQEPATPDPATPSPVSEGTEVPEQPEPEASPAVTAEKEEKPAPEEKAYQPVQHDEPAPHEPMAEETPEVVTTEPEKVPLEILQTDKSGISFEPPVAPEPKTEINEELLAEAPAVNPHVAAIPLPDMKPEAQAKPGPANLFSAAGMPRDIRTAIGINDKYLFLNELFSNHKSNYEETLDRLNQFATARQAEDWIRTKVAPANKWDMEDSTVESFYALLNKHFSER